MYRLIFIEHLLHKLDFKDKAEVIVVTFWMHFLFGSNTCNINQEQVSHSLSFQ